VNGAEVGRGLVRRDPTVAHYDVANLEWARATVPTPHGFITVEARADGTVIIDSPVPVVRD